MSLVQDHWIIEVRHDSRSSMNDLDGMMSVFIVYIFEQMPYATVLRQPLAFALSKTPFRAIL